LQGMIESADARLSDNVKFVRGFTITTMILEHDLHKTD